MPTTWPASLDVLQGAAQRFARLVDEMSGGRLTIEVAPAGQIMPALGVFDACSQGTVESFMGASYYWDKKEPATQWFCTVPFGMNPQGMQAWYFEGEGLKLWEETYAAFGLVPRPAAPVPRKWPAGSARRSTPSPTSRGSRCASPGSADRSYPSWAARWF